MAVFGGRLEDFDIKVDRDIFHMQASSGTASCYLCLYPIQNVPSLVNSPLHFYRYSQGYQHGMYDVRFSIYKGKILVYFCPEFYRMQWNVTAYSSDSGTVPFRLIRESYEVAAEDFQKQTWPDSLVIICRKKCSPIYQINGHIPCKITTTEVDLGYLMLLKTDLKNYSGGSSEETVELCVGQEMETANKAILCLRSPVFAKMFQNDMKERKDNTVVISDVKMSVVKEMVSFLHSGILPRVCAEELFRLYNVADKYDIAELRWKCIVSLVRAATLENLFRLWKLSLLHHDEILKILVMAIIGANSHTIATTPEWKQLMCCDPVTALNAFRFFDELKRNY